MLSTVKRLAYNHYKDNKRVYLWLNASNPMLRGITPLEAIHNGQGDKLVKLMKDSLTN